MSSSEDRISAFRAYIDQGLSIEEAAKEVPGFEVSDLVRYYRELSVYYQSEADKLAERKRGETPKEPKEIKPEVPPAVHGSRVASLNDRWAPTR